MMNGATAAGRQQMWRDRVIALIAGVIAAIAIILVFTSEFLGLPGHWTGPAVVGRTAAMTNMLRIGLNLGNQRADGESDFMQNLFDDPGFEPSIECQLAQVSSQSGTAITVSQWSNGSECNRFWAPGGCTSDGSSGAEGSVRISTTGASLGQTFTVSANTSANSLTCASTCPTLSSGDWISLCKQGPGVASNAFSLGAGWGPGGIGNSDSNVTISYAQHYEGQTALSMVVADGASHKVQFGWDSGGANGGVCSNDNVTPCTVANQTADCGVGNTCQTAPEAGPFHPFVAGKTYAIAFYAKAVNATAPSASVSLARGGGTNILHTFTLINDGVWHQYVYNFNGGDTVTTKDVLTFTLSATNGGAHTGATIYVDDVYLGLAAAAATGFRPEVVTSLTALKPGSLRYMIPSTLDSNDQVFEGPSGCTPGAVGIAGYTSGGCDYLRGGSTTNTGTNLYTYWNWYFGSADVYPLAATVGAVPWVSIPDTFSDADLKTFADNVCTAISTYGFSTVWIEQSNEDWNGIGGGAHFAAASDYYGRLTGRNFNVLSTEISAHCAGSASKIHYIYGNQECNNGVLTAALAGASAAGFPIPNTSNYGSDDATYVSGNRVNPGQLPSYSGSLTSQAGQYAALFFDYAANYNFGANPGCVPGDQRQLLSNQTMAVYESGVGAFNGPGTTEQAYLSEGGFPSAGWMAQNWLLGIQSLLPVQNAFTLTQVEFGYGGSFPYVPAWGLLHDLDADFGPTFPHLRPTGLALAVLNRAITLGGEYHQVIGLPAGIICDDFTAAGGTSHSTVCSNSSATSISVSVTYPTSTTVPSIGTAVLNTNGLTDNNENSVNVKIGTLPGGVGVVGQTATLTMPPFGVVALTQ